MEDTRNTCDVEREKNAYTAKPAPGRDKKTQGNNLLGLRVEE